MQVSVIIVNYNVKYFTEQCLYSVVKACKNLAAEIIVVDNHSDDDSRNFFSNKFANVQFIWNKENSGFSKANNIGLRHASGQYILFLNPDTLIPEDCLEKCIAFYGGQKNIGAMGIRMIDGEGNFLKESKRGFPSITTSFFKMSGLAALFPHSALFARYYLGNTPDNINQPAPVLSGAFMMVAKEVLDVTGSFDEDFFMYAEDIDLSYRIHQAGYKNFYFSESTIVHFKGESTKKSSLQYVWSFYNAMDLFVQKHYCGAKAILYRIFIHIAMGLQTTATLVKRMFFLIKAKRKNKFPKALSALIVGSQTDCERVVCLMKNAGAKLKIIGRIDTTDLPGSLSLGNVQQLPELIGKYAIEVVVFCINEHSLKEIITFIQGVHPPVSFRFHRAGSGGIVGSSNKNTPGYRVAVQE